MTTHTPEEVNFYILEFGTESLRIFTKSPHVGDILYLNDSEKIRNLFKLIRTEIDRRKKLFRDYSGDYATYVKTSGQSVPNFVIIINNYEAFNEVYSSYEDTILQLTREGVKFGIYFILTTSASNMIRYRLAQNFKQKIVLQLNDENDYSAIFGNIKGKKPSEILGRGLVNLDSVYEFQTASITEEEKVNELIRNTCNELYDSATFKAKAVPILPAKVTFDFVKSEFKGLNTIPIGVEKASLDVRTIDILRSYTTLLTSLDIMTVKPLLNEICKEISMINNIKYLAIDAEEIIDKENLKEGIYRTDINEVFTELNSDITNVHDTYVNSNYDKNAIANVPITVCIIGGIDKFQAKLSPDNKKLFGKMFENGKDLEKYCFIFADSVDKFKKVEYDDWYRNTVNNNRGIWIGDGIANQFAIKLTKTSKELYEEVGNRFGYYVERGNPTLIKLLEKGDGVSE